MGNVPATSQVAKTKGVMAVNQDAAVGSGRWHDGRVLDVFVSAVRVSDGSNGGVYFRLVWTDMRDVNEQIPDLTAGR
ncbi:MAG: hypothetical protein Alpg2KO_07650 [Alphaproteobacteria bacterium]